MPLAVNVSADLILTLVALLIGVATALDIGGIARRMSRANGEKPPAHQSRGERFFSSVMGARVIGLLVVVGALVWLIWPGVRR